jgi:glycerol-3-phosphate dehydrogenase
MTRDEMFERIADRHAPWDIVVIGGGATGVGIAVDAANRGYATLLLEQSDFGKGTSSRSTKLVHGGVRYLQQGNIRLVREALRERGLLLNNAPHLVHSLRFVIPTFQWWERPYYATGLKFYAMLSGKHSFGRSGGISFVEARECLSTVKTEKLRGGVEYYDGQFDDARLLITLVRTAISQDAVVLNQAPVTGLLKSSGDRVDGVLFVDKESGREHEVRAKAVVNATGAFSDQVVQMDDPQAAKMIAPSQGIHLVVPKSFLPGDSAMLIPKTRDGRVMFAIPWHDHVLLGTTDTPIEQVSLEPRPLDEEVDFVLETAADYLKITPTREDVTSVFVGIRPLVKSGGAKNTAKLSREHTIAVSQSGLVTICGGKWTTYRRMAEDCVNRVAELVDLEARSCATAELPLQGSADTEDTEDIESEPCPEHLRVYGSDATEIVRLSKMEARLAEPLHESLPFQAIQVIWAVHNEMARTVDDVLSRRTRMLLLNAQAAIDSAAKVAELMATELGKDDRWQQSQVEEFKRIAQGYCIGG